MKDTQEVWIDIEKLEGKYQVSDMGNIKTIGRYSHAQYSKRWISEGLKNQNKDRDGYPQVCLSFSPKKRRYAVHRLVALYFVPNPKNKPQVNHLNGIKTDNRAVNLEWCTSQENVIHFHEVLGGYKKSKSRKDV